MLHPSALTFLSVKQLAARPANFASSRSFKRAFVSTFVCVFVVVVVLFVCLFVVFPTTTVHTFEATFL